ncbi:sensor histidine kinase [Levilactobacillus acidifarinae]|uniref:histidine kinase n=1 Tax=Levilactobacillus acidifarinae DSM 19394 = JCM 15949 TaxID=1423715 RepID=A0A0R1LVL2_9LACO|nr:HAMP domain-containing sensor histidine kinase [Levilactobacillus acidifarinae]KRK96322.1 Signal transduction histidine kinase [Levilactobacillus acidifarinae DSM 19394]GEO69099.1 signal transduction histidine kinase [Levilactobacillus acidifarinae]
MKLMYQQMLGFFAAITIILVLLGVSYTQMTRRMVYSNTWNSLEKYSNSLIEQSLRISADNPKTVNFDTTALENSEQLLQNQAVSVTIYSADNKIVFPANLYQQSINQTDWRKLKDNQIIHKVVDRRVRNKNGRITPAMTEVMKPYFYNHKLVAVVVMGAFVSDINTNINQINHNLIRALFVSILVAIVASYILARYYTNRINRLRAATNQVALGDYDVQMVSRNRDEIDDLINDFNGMTHSLKESQEEIQRQEQRRREFMANASHEMRTPLTTINGLLEGLAYDAIPEESKEESIDLMRSETSRLIRLVNENLDYEKIRSNQITLNLHEFNAVDALHNIVEQLKQKAEDSGDTLELEVPDSVAVYADYDRFVQIMFNITQNAIQFTQDGQVTISAQRGYEEAIIRVADTGMGMSDEQLKNIWERYYKADPSRKNTKYGESGLGLSIVHQLVQLHHGKISVTSKEGVGTTFTVIFPDQHQTNANRAKTD